VRKLHLLLASVGLAGFFFSVGSAWAVCNVTSGSGTVGSLNNGDVVTCDTVGGDQMSTVGDGSDAVSATVNLTAGAGIDVGEGDNAIMVDRGDITLGDGASIQVSDGGIGILSSSIVGGNVTQNLTLGANATIITEGTGYQASSVGGAASLTSNVMLTGAGAMIQSQNGGANAISLSTSGDLDATITIAAGASLVSQQSAAISLSGGEGTSVIDNAGSIQGALFGNSIVSSDETEDTLILRTGSNLSSGFGVDLGDENDRLVLVGNGAENEVFRNIETVDVNADMTGFELSGTSTFDDINVNTGLFRNNGMLTVNNDVEVFAGAIFGGTGTTTGAVINNGTVAPGDSGIGTQNIVGDFTQNGDGALDIEFSNAGIDLLNITGNATLAGTLNLIELAPGTTVDTPFTFLQTTGTITGDFSPVNQVFLMGSDLFDATVDIGANAATVTFSNFVAMFGDSGETSSGTSLGNAIDSAAVSDPAGTMDIINGLLAASDTGDALESQTNIVASNTVTQANNSITHVTNVVRGRFASGGSAGTSTGAIGSFDQNSFGFTNSSDDFSAHSIANVLNEQSTLEQLAQFATASGGDFESPFGSYWIQAVGGYSEIETDSRGRGSDSLTYGITAGTEYNLEDRQARVGFFAGITKSETDIDGLNDESEVLNYQLGAYGQKRFDDNWHANAVVSLSYFDFETTRPTGTGVAEADFNGFGGHATAEVLYDFKAKNNVVISPFVGVEASFVDREGYTESGAGALNNTVDDETNEFLSSVLGVQASSDYVFNKKDGQSLKFSPSVRVGWAHQYLDDSASTTASFTNAPNISFDTQGPSRNRDSLRVDINLNLSEGSDDQWSAFVRYTGDVTSNAQDHVVRIGAGWKF
jgi:fibronectin-binding autotransporter adhesin